jgi:ArsR family metal-binding transcriptional regulator
MRNDLFRRPGYSFRLVNIECLPGSTNFNVVMELEDSIKDLLPYLAAHLPGCTYTHGTDVINFMDHGHIVAIYPQHLTITDLKDQDQAESYCSEYYRNILHVRAHSSKIAPVFEKRPSLSVLDILRLLPKTNCRECGAVSCMAFAASVFRREELISKCTPLITDEPMHQQLMHKLKSNGYVI